MGRLFVALMVLVGACRSVSHATDGGSVDGSPADDAPIDQRVLPDTPCVPLVGPTCGGKLWAADLSVDPTKIDLNCDGFPDFHLPQDAPLPGTLTAGVWADPAFAPPLETQPLDPFLTRTIVHARMRNVSIGNTPTPHGAILRINVDFDGTNLGVVFVEVALIGGGASQNITLFTKTDSNVDIVLDPIQGFDTGFHDIDLDIDPPSRVIVYTIDGVSRGSFGFQRILAGTNNDQFASFTNGSTNAEFDAVAVERCP